MSDLPDRYRFILKISLLLLFAIIIVWVVPFLFETDKTVTGTVVQNEAIQSQSYFHPVNKKAIIKKQNLILETGKSGNVIEISLINEEPILVGQIIEVRNEGGDYILARIIK